MYIYVYVYVYICMWRYVYTHVDLTGADDPLPGPLLQEAALSHLAHTHEAHTLNEVMLDVVRDSLFCKPC